MRYQNGWIKFYREIRYKDFYKDLRLRGLVMDLLLVANYEESKIRLGKELRTLKPGQILTKASELSQNNPIPPRTIHRLLARLELDGFISQELTSRGTIVTICNWNKYQANTSDNSSDLATEWRRSGDGMATEWRRNGDGMATEWRRSGHIERIKEPKNQENKKQEFNSLPANPAGSAGGESELLVMIPKEKSKRQKAPTEKTDGSKVWDSYAAAYEKVWNAPPVRNAKSNKICAELVKRLGAEEAPLVAAFYPTHRSSFYVQALHPLTLLARDCEKLRTEWVNGQTMTSTFARQIDKSSALDAVFERQIAKVRREESAKNDQPS